MTVEKNKVVAVSYELEVEGKVSDKADSENPLEYIHGSGMLLPKFEAAIEGKEPGETVSFTLAPEDGYGVYEDAYKIEVPKSAFVDQNGQLREDLLQVGNIIPMFNSEGQVVQGSVAAVAEENVTMDFNHPMAGKTLNFTVKVESVREATEKELAEGLHGEYLPKEGCHCGGHCHEDGEGCGCGEGCHCEEEGHECRCHEGEGHNCHCHEDK